MALLFKVYFVILRNVIVGDKKYINYISFIFRQQLIQYNCRYKYRAALIYCQNNTKWEQSHIIFKWIFPTFLCCWTKWLNKQQGDCKHNTEKVYHRCVFFKGVGPLFQEKSDCLKILQMVSKNRKKNAPSPHFNPPKSPPPLNPAYTPLKCP